MATLCDVATGITLSLETSSFTANIIDIGLFEVTREAIDCTHQASTAREFEPGSLLNYGECTLGISWLPSSVVPVSAAPEEFTFTFPVITSGNTAATWACDGFITKLTVTNNLETKMEGEVTIKWTGLPTYTAEAAP